MSYRVHEQDDDDDDDEKKKEEKKKSPTYKHTHSCHCFSRSRQSYIANPPSSQLLSVFPL